MTIRLSRLRPAGAFFHGAPAGPCPYPRTSFLSRARSLRHRGTAKLRRMAVFSFTWAQGAQACSVTAALNERSYIAQARDSGSLPAFVPSQPFRSARASGSSWRIPVDQEGGAKGLQSARERPPFACFPEHPGADRSPTANAGRILATTARRRILIGGVNAASNPDNRVPR